MSLVGKKAPNFVAPAVINGDEIVENFSLPIGEKNIVLFFYPKDFTFVCPTELHAFQSKLAEFEKRDAVVIAASCDSEETHLAWLTTAKDNGGIEGVTYPVVADLAKTIAMDYGVLAGDYVYNEERDALEFEGLPVAFRGTFIIDKNGVVRHETINDLPLGRNIDEYVRLLDAILHVEKYGEVCPANWEEGKEAMNATKEGVATYLSKN
ncbi:MULTISPECIES: peroxiredoxin [Weeksella]|uniref:Thioredoxin peroxidase n=1 Tax=Weeksella virosa (strain ATCC 43766 / DSM 16922 / JCM 21250 / CCUG 30538 / CDC 9751 / IAM 14551 / NBRC 16016 / NCTC 11634 / CL345/78) TaxID=865938 RepID=F0P2N5_WEEVC|nr:MULTISPECIES: peroxiredoxin [Weeksella]ADX67874.1 Peroxiredoxin [Weeksella virosa DSM 16922]MDK7374163.1 peroxiredoxin [Weeksella virosa]MDK7674475.1 peroxiredoxin [Weeksella virosa]OFM82841.1 alkyl hydroperoxide reductase [Weeksella sp. HMSC059D05]SUP54177.1 Probable peroxiredoxin [Weeksella virosa]